MSEPSTQHVALKDQLAHSQSEARMVLPGIQALFGFQTIATFNSRFAELPQAAVWTHLGALGLNALAIALIMAPTAYHRLAQPATLSEELVRRYSRFISAAMFPLAASFALEMTIVVATATGSAASGVIAGCANALVIASLWFALPLYRRLQAR